MFQARFACQTLLFKTSSLFLRPALRLSSFQRFSCVGKCRRRFISNPCKTILHPRIRNAPLRLMPYRLGKMKKTRVQLKDVEK